MVDDLSTLTDEVDDIQEELGPNPQGVYASVRVRLDILEARINNPLAPAPTVTNPFIIGNSGVTISAGSGAPNTSPVPGSLYLREDGYITLYSFIDGYGWSPISGSGGGGGGGSQNLSQVLSLGNATGGHNILLTAGDNISGTDGYVRLNGNIINNSLTANSVVATRSDKSLKSISPIGQQYSVLMETPVGNLTFSNITQDMISPSFLITLSGGQLVEVGTTVTTPSFTATYNRTPTTAVLTDSDGNAPKNVISSPTLFNSNFNFTKNTFGAGVTFTLTAGDGVVSKTATTTYTWCQKTYHGVGAPGQNTAAFILSLTGVLDTNIGFVFTDNAGPSQKIYYASRAAYANPTFTVGGFVGGFTLVSNSIAVTNSHGITENYQLWESDNLGLGLTTVTVS